MTRSDRPSLTAWGRLGLTVIVVGLTIIMLGLSVYNSLGLGTFGSSVTATVYAILTAVAGTLLVVGLVSRWQWAAEWGLLLSCWTLATRAIFVLLTDGWVERATVLSTGCAVIAAGAYWLERTDRAEGGR